MTADDRGSPHEYALRLLTARSYTVRDLRRKLVGREYPEPEVQATIDRLLRSGLLDDASYAQRFARGKLVSDGASRRRVAQLLARKGIAPELARSAVEQVVAEEEVDPAAAVDRVARRKLASLTGLEEPVRRRRLFAFLARRGYEVDHIRSAVDRLLREERV